MKLFAKFSHQKFFSFAAFAVALFLLQSCSGYYNTFYNTKKVYKEALEEQKRRTSDKPGSSEIQKYDKAIEKASKLLQFHPKSGYVDDALILIGECFYYKQDFLKAQRKFQELITLYPKSGLLPRAQLWLAKTNIEMNDYPGAIQALRELEEKEKKGEWVDQGRYLLGEIYFRQKQYAEAAKEYEAAARKLDDEATRSKAYMRLGESYMALKEYGPASEALRRASAAAKNDINLKFAARLQYAVALKNDRKLTPATQRLDEMLKEFGAHRDLPLVKIELAECANLQGKTESAIRQYTSIIESHQRTDASAAAYFALGEINERRFAEYKRAKDNYDNVRRESARYEKATEAEQRSKAITAFIKLKETIETLERQRAVLAGGRADSLRRLKTSDDQDKKESEERRAISRIPRRAKAASGTALASASTSKDPQKIAAELAKTKILLAELYLFNFDRPDSAMREYLDVFEFYPKTDYAPQAMYSLAYILGEAPATLAMRDSVLSVLANKYGQTGQGQIAKRRLGRGDTLARTPSWPNLLREAESNLVAKKNPKRALQLYEEFLQKQPDAKLAAQAIYAMGWIYEHELADNQQALAAYKKLLETYPESPMARRVRAKVTAVEKKKNEPAKPAPVAPPLTPTPADTQKVAAPELDDDALAAKRAHDLQKQQQQNQLIKEELDEIPPDTTKQEPPKKEEPPQ